MNVDWLKRRWLDFRNGHGLYLAFALSFISFVVINYNLLGLVQRVFPNILVFAFVFAVIYIPLATLVGYKWHRKKQMPTDLGIATITNPYNYKAIPQGKEMLLGLPAQRLALVFNRRLWKKFGLLSPEEEQLIEELIEKTDRLLRGEKLK